MPAALFDDKKLRSDFKPEITRILSAINQCNVLDAKLNELSDAYTRPVMTVPGQATTKIRINTERGAASYFIRLTEQVISNRAQRRDLIKLLWAVKGDVLDRDIKLAERKVAAEQPGLSAVNHALLEMLQQKLLGPQSFLLLEPGEVLDAEADRAISLRLPAPPPPEAIPGVAWPDGLPETAEVGDVVSDTQGDLWVVGPDGAEAAEGRAEEVFLTPPDEAPPYARLESGRLVLVFDVTAKPEED